MKLSELPDDFTPEQFRQLDKESLDAIPFTRLRWLCQCKGCTNGTHVRDYGLGKWWLLDRNSKGIAKDTSGYWMGLYNYWLCGKHNRLFKRLEKRFDIEHIWRRLLDPTKEVRIEIKTGDLSTIKRVEKHEKKVKDHD